MIIRPRGGDFLYSEPEFATHARRCPRLRELGAAGVVFGCLTADGRIDEARMTRADRGGGADGVTCHRAFDMTRDPEEAVEALIRSGVDRVLTSGQRDTAVEGDRHPQRHVAAAGGRHHHHGLRRARSRQHRGS